VLRAGHVRQFRARKHQLGIGATKNATIAALPMTSLVDAGQPKKLTQIKAHATGPCDSFFMSGHVITAVATSQHNHLLAALHAEVWDRNFPNLRLVSLPLGAVLYRSGDAPRHAYFPIDSIVALLHILASGASTEISLVGNEGLIGITSVMGGESAPREAVVLSAGFAYQLPIHQLKEEFNRNSEMLRLLLRYTQSLMTQVAQTAVCNRYHSIEQHLCTWLLRVLDRLPSNRLAVTQGLIADMLGVRRESITEAAQKLQKLGALEYRRGEVVVLDRHKLEQLACECYAVVKKEAARLLPNLTRIGSNREAAEGSRQLSPDSVLRPGLLNVGSNNRPMRIVQSKISQQARGIHRRYGGPSE
jgi:CRP-like cAMP-binding protein